MTDTCLYNVYLISGGCRRVKDGPVEVIEESAVPVRDAFFSRLNHQEHSLITTDEHGMLGSIGNGGNKLSRINDQCLGPMKLVPVPPGVARLSYFAHDKEWQNELVQHIREMNPQDTLDPIPVTFTAKHLRPAAKDDATEKKLLENFAGGRTFRGQLIPRFHVLALVIDHRVLGSAPETLTAHRDKQSIHLHRSPRPVYMGEPPSAPQAWVYSASGSTLTEGTYSVEIKSDAIAKPFRSEQGDTIRRTFDVAFSVHTLFGDFDFQVFDFPTVEGAILTHFAEKYPHILVPEQEGPSDKRSNPAYAQAEGALAQYRQTAGFLNDKRKWAVGFVNADSSTKARQIIGASLVGIRDSKTEGVSDAAELAAKMCERAYESQKVYKEWKELVAKYSIKLDNAKALGLVREVMDDKSIATFFHKTEWRKTAIDAMHQSQEKQPNLLGRYLLWRKDKADPAVLKKLMEDASSPRLSAFELAARGELPPVKSVALWAINAKNTIAQACETISALKDLFQDEDKLDSHLRDALTEYVKKFQVHGKGSHESGFAPCTEIVPRLEVLRKAADAASLATDKKLLEATKQAAHLTLQAISLVPAAQPFMSLATQVGDSLEALGSVVEVASDAIDHYLFRHKSSISRFSELAQLHMLQVRGIANAQKDGKGKHDDPYTQFRLRLIVLIGLLRLVERCGSPSDKDFDQKVIENDIDGYLDHYVFANNFPIALSSGTPLDEIWTYGCNRKRFDWKDVEARVMSLGDSFADLIRGTKTVYVPVMFQKYFPICGKSSRSAPQLARAFSLDFSGVIDNDLVFSRIYVRQGPKDKWVGVEDAKAFIIEPGTPVRVAAVFKNKNRTNLSGVPVSLQVVRVDSICSIEGPVYTSCLAHVWQSAEASDGHEDKGLLPYVDDEKKYIGDNDAYACVFYPFYFFQKKLIYGIKPLGHIGLSGDITYDVSFTLKAGDDGKYIDAGKLAEAARTEGKAAAFYPIMGTAFAAKAALDEAKGRTVRVHMPTSKRVYVDMILNKEFLEHKDPQPHWENMFKHEWQRYQVGAVYWRGKEGTWHYSGTEGGRFVTKLGPSQFAWGEPFELLVVFSSVFAIQQRWPGDPIKVPAYMDVKELSISGGDEAQGPAYPVEVVSLHRDRQFSGAVDAMTIQSGLHASGLLAANERFVPAGFGLIEPSVLWAVRAKFEFQIQGKDGSDKPGLLQAQVGMRPFGRTFMDRYGGYIYKFGLSAPGNIGLSLPGVAECTVPGISEDAFPQSFLDNPDVDRAKRETWNWVNEESKWTSLEVKKAK